MENDILYLVIPFAITLIAGVPVAFCLGIACVGYLTLAGDLPLNVLAQQMYNSAASFPLMAIPFFIFAGDLMNESTITERLVGFCKILLSRVHGGLAHSMVATGTLFAGLTGSACADTAATIKILGPAMEKEGYPPAFNAAVAASTGVLGPIIPPSTIMIVYGATVGTSVGAMFMGGVMPGLFLAALLMIVIALRTRKMKLAVNKEKLTFGLVIKGFKDASLALVMPVIIIVGIRGGMFTPTEGGAVAVAYSLLLGGLVYRSLTLKKVFISAVGSATTAAVIMLVVSSSQPFGWIIAVGQGPAIFCEYMLTLTSNPYVILLLVNLLLLLSGMFLEGAAIVLLLAPILHPLAVSVGFHPVHFAVLMSVNICIGMITPPLGVNLFVAAPIAKVTMSKLVPEVLPFLCALLVGLVVINLWPALTLWLPYTFK